MEEITSRRSSDLNLVSPSACGQNTNDSRQADTHPHIQSLGSGFSPSPLTTSTGAGEWEHPHGSRHPVWASHLSDFLSQGDGLTRRNPPTHAPPHTEGPSGQVRQKAFSMGVLTWHLHFESRPPTEGFLSIGLKITQLAFTYDSLHCYLFYTYFSDVFISFGSVMVSLIGLQIVQKIWSF